MVTQHDSPVGRWEMATRRPHPAVRGAVRDLWGFEERTPAPHRRRELPVAGVVLLISFGEPWTFDYGGTAPIRRTSFVAGLDGRPVFSEHAGAAGGIQAGLTPLGAAALLGLPAGPLAGEIVELGDVLGDRAAGELAEQLALAPDWAARFALFERWALGRLYRRAAPARPAAVDRAWGRIEATHGAVTVAELAAELRCSRRWLSGAFAEHVGMAPKAVARLMRFARLRERLRTAEPGQLARIAADCGYADHAHLTRDVREFTGLPPSELLASRLPGQGGIADDAPGAVAA